MKYFIISDVGIEKLRALAARMRSDEPFTASERMRTAGLLESIADLSERMPDDLTSRGTD